MKKGFTLIEIVISVTLLAMFFVIAASTATLMVQSMKVSQNKVLASFYAEDMLSWIEAQRDLDRDALKAKATTPSNGQTYCVNTEPLRGDTMDSILVSGSCPNFNGVVRPSAPSPTPSHDLDTNPKIFKREVFLQGTGAANDIINVKVTVSWQDLGRTYNVELNNTFSTVD